MKRSITQTVVVPIGVNTPLVQPSKQRCGIRICTGSIPVQIGFGGQIASASIGVALSSSSPDLSLSIYIDGDVVQTAFNAYCVTGSVSLTVIEEFPDECDGEQQTDSGSTGQTESSGKFSKYRTQDRY